MFFVVDNKLNGNLMCGLSGTHENVCTFLDIVFQCRLQTHNKLTPNFFSIIEISIYSFSCPF